MTDIPRARQILTLALEQLTIAVSSLDTALKLMTRPPPVRRAKAKSQHMTPELAMKIKVYADNHPKLSLADIGRTFNVNAGRVSEALRKFK
jgi:hypothetical protein